MVKAVDANYLGGKEPEAIFEELDTNALQYSTAFSWYNYFFDEAKYKKYLSNYMAPSYTEEEIRILRKTTLQSVFYAIARMKMLGWNLPGKFTQKLNDKIKDVISGYVEVQEEKPAPVNIQARVRDRQYMLIAVFELELDQFFQNYESKFNPYDYLNKMQVPPIHASAVSQHYEKLLKEMESIDTDADIKYGYRNLTKKQFKNYREFVKLIVDDANRWTNNKKKSVSRAPRVIKEKSPDKIIKDLKYQKDFAELKLVSVDPISIVKAESLWVYSTKYKILTVYHALTGGFNVEGTTLKNWSTQDSVSKTLRKPESTINTLLSTGKVGLRGLMGTLTTKPAKPNGRINSDTILVKVIR